MSRMREAMVCGRLCIAPEGDYYVKCSFNSNHVLLRSRLPYHIVKCVKNYPGHNKMQCPYDSTEYIDPEEFPNHLLTCESRRSIFDERYQTADLKARNSIGNIQQTPFFHSSIPEPDEDWGADPIDEEMKEDKEDNQCGRTEGVGRGWTGRQVRETTPPGNVGGTTPKRGLGRAEIIFKIIEDHQKRKSAKISSSSYASQPGQFDD